MKKKVLFSFFSILTLLVISTKIIAKTNLINESEEKLQIKILGKNPKTINFSPADTKEIKTKNISQIEVIETKKNKKLDINPPYYSVYIIKLNNKGVPYIKSKYNLK